MKPSTALVHPAARAARAPSGAKAMPATAPHTPRAFVCRCGRPIFFRNSECLACHTPLGYEPEQQRLLPLQPVAPQVEGQGTWREADAPSDALDTAHSFGLDSEHVELDYDRFGAEALSEPEAEGAPFLSLVNQWIELTGALNELSRSMGVPDFYPFVLSVAAVRKLHLVHRVIATAS